MNTNKKEEVISLNRILTTIIFADKIVLTRKIDTMLCSIEFLLYANFLF